MEVGVFPISGGQFPAQVATASLLSETGYRPDVCLASSGGSVTSFLMHACKWDSKKVPLVMENLSSSMFMSMRSIPLIHSLMSLCYGSIYDKGQGGMSVFCDILDSENLKYIETWVGAYNKTKGKFKVMSNMSRGKSKGEDLKFEATPTY